MRVVLLLLGIAFAAPLAAQDAAKDVKPRVYIAAGAAWRENNQGAGARAEPEIRTVEIAADFSHSCGTAITVTADLRAADYVAEFSRHVKAVPLTAISVSRTDVSIYRTSADLVGASSKASLGAAVKAACEAVRKDWPEAPRDITPKRRDPHPTGRTAAFPQ
jgi:hypothetical protein